MSNTVTEISSARKTVRMGIDKPFCVIGERINPTGRKLLAAEMKEMNFDRVKSDAIAQIDAGATALDVNAGIPLADEPKILAEAIKLLQSITDTPLVIDSSVLEALEAGLAVYNGKALLNSVTGEEDRLAYILPLVKKYECAVIGISNDEEGISEDPDVRYAVAKKIVERAEDYGIARCNVVIDPLVMPIGALSGAGKSVFRLVRRLHEELGVNTSCGASNISFGLPARHELNASFLTMAIGAGMTSAILNPLHEQEMVAIDATEVMRGTDVGCGKWIKRFQSLTSEKATSESGRRVNRRRKVV